MISLQSLFEAGIVPSILILGGSLYIAILLFMNIYYAIIYLIKRIFNKSMS
ncbi:MAG TPA: hypothetical protein VEY70_23275 [Metabacillus sp.]|nr:hypothetical protein [Metabacillus sp.]